MDLGRLEATPLPTPLPPDSPPDAGPGAVVDPRNGDNVESPLTARMANLRVAPRELANFGTS